MQLNDQWTEARVETTRDLSPTVREFTLQPAGGAVHWSVGSHLRVRLSVDGAETLRTYSLVGLPGDSAADGCYRVAVKRVEPSRGGSRHMWRLGVGATVSIAAVGEEYDDGASADSAPEERSGLSKLPVMFCNRNWCRDECEVKGD